MLKIRLPHVIAAAVGAAILLTTAACSAQPTQSTSKTLTLAVGHPLGELNPRVMAGDFPGLDLIFEPLIRYGRDGTLEPALAAKWKVATDGLSATFDLRKNVVFTDGTPFDATAAKWNFDQWVGKADYSSIGASQFITGVNVTGPLQVTLALSKPYSGLLQELSLVRPVRFSSPASVDSAGKFTGPIGTGPYSITRNDNQGATFVPNKKYWGGTPKYDSLVWRIIDDSGSRSLALRAGEVDLIGGDWLSPISPVEASQLAKASGVKVVTEPGLNTLLLGFNATTGPASESQVRSAIASAIDTTVVAKVYFRGYAKPATALYPPAIANSPTDTFATFDLAKAKSALQAAGWVGDKSGRTKAGAKLSMNLLVSDAVLPGSRLLSQQIQASLQELGIAVQIQTVDSTTYFDRVSRGAYDLTFYQTYGAPYDPLSTLTFLFDSAGDPSEGRIYASDAIDAGIAAARVAITPAETSAAYSSIYAAMKKDTAFVPLVWPSRIWATGSKLPNFSLAPTEYGLPLSTLVGK